MSAALPFSITRSTDVIRGGSVTTTAQEVQGLLHLGEHELRVQWRLSTTVSEVGPQIRSDTTVDGVRELAIPLEAIAGATVRRAGMWWSRHVKLVLTAADLMAFEPLCGPSGLGLDHPAELTLRLRRGDELAAEEFAGELALALAERDSGRRAISAPSAARIPR